MSFEVIIRLAWFDFTKCKIITGSNSVEVATLACCVVCIKAFLIAGNFASSLSSGNCNFPTPNGRLRGCWIIFCRRFFYFFHWKRGEIQSAFASLLFVCMSPFFRFSAGFICRGSSRFHVTWDSTYLIHRNFSMGNLIASVWGQKTSRTSCCLEPSDSSDKLLRKRWKFPFLKMFSDTYLYDLVQEIDPEILIRRACCLMTLLAYATDLLIMLLRRPLNKWKDDFC